MRKISVLLIFVMIFLIFSTCKAETPSDKTESIEKGLRVVNKDDYLSEYASLTDNMVLYKEKINLADAYKNIESIDISGINTPLANMDCMGIDNYGNVYYEKNQIMIANAEPSYIYRYLPYEKKWEKLIETDGKTQCTIISIDDKYMFWHEDENANWSRSSLNMYDLETKTNTKIYTYSRDENGVMYSWQFDAPVVIDGKVYFADTVGVDKENYYKIKIFSYDISNGNIIEVASDSKKVMEYKDKPAWLTISEDKTNCLFYAESKSGYWFKEITGLGTIFASKGNVLVANDYMTAADFEKIKEGTAETLGNNVISPTNPRECYGIRKYGDDKTEPIIAFWDAGGYIDGVRTNGKIVTWCGSNTGMPMFYDSISDKIVTFENYIDSETISSNTYVSDNYILVCSSCEVDLIEEYKLTIFKLN